MHFPDVYNKLPMHSQDAEAACKLHSRAFLKPLNHALAVSRLLAGFSKGFFFTLFFYYYYF